MASSLSPPPPPPQSLDYWRWFFSEARATIFDTIDAAIRVAAADHPDGLRARRDAIAKGLFTALNGLPPSEAVEPSPAAAAPPLAQQEQHQQLLPEGAGSGPSLCSSDGAADAPRWDSDDPVVAEVFRVKAALSSNQQKSEAELLELLQRLEQLEFTVGIIKVTEIGATVNPLRKHCSKQIRHLVRSLIEGWKAIVHQWVNNEDAIIDHTPQSMDASCLELEGGLPSPPMDEAGLFTTPCTYMQLSEFFDEMDEDGNIRIHTKDGEQYPTNQDLVEKQPPAVQRYDPVENWRLDQSTARQSQPHEPSSWQTGVQSIMEAQGKMSSATFGRGRPPRLHFEPRSSGMKPKQQQDISVAQRRLKPTMPNPLSQHDPNSVQSKLELAKNAKLEATKRKLQEGYQEFNNAKKQRTIQVVDPQDLPKQGNKRLQPSGKPRNNKASNIRNRLGIRR